MKPFKRLLLQSKPMFYIFLMILGVNIFINLIAGVVITTNATQFYPASIAMSIWIFLTIFLGIQSVFLISNCFPMSLIMGSTRKQTAKHIFLLILMISIILSLILNSTFIFSNQFMIGKTIIPHLLGYNWNIIDGLFLKLISLTLIFLAFSASLLWITSGFKMTGIFSGLTRIVLLITLLLTQDNLIKNYVEWGQNPLQIHMMLLIVAFLTLYLTYQTLTRYEFK